MLGHCKTLCHHRSHFVMANVWPCMVSMDYLSGLVPSIIYLARYLTGLASSRWMAPELVMLLLLLKDQFYCQSYELSIWVKGHTQGSHYILSPFTTSHKDDWARYKANLVLNQPLSPKYAIDRLDFVCDMEWRLGGLWQWFQLVWRSQGGDEVFLHSSSQ